MEVGWYLRFAKADHVEALISLKGIEQVRHAMYIHTDWTLEIEETGEHAVARFARKNPRFGSSEGTTEGTEKEKEQS